MRGMQRGMPTPHQRRGVRRQMPTDLSATGLYPFPQVLADDAKLGALQDAPLAGIPMHVKALDGLNLDAVTYKKIMHGNAEKLLNMRIS